MKRWISLLLCLTMAGSLLPFALADGETAEARLKRVTEQVKTTLDLDTDRYTDFRGDLSEQELGNVWSLNWSGDGASMSIEALEDGTVVSYWLSGGDADYTYLYTQGLPAFPDADPAEARRAAAAFLDRVLKKDTESVELKEPDRQLRSTSVRFYGNLLLNGLPSPLTYSVTVRGSDSVVTGFRRDAPSRAFLGSIPGPDPAVEKDAAAAKLKTTETLELLYVLDEDAASSRDAGPGGGSSASRGADGGGASGSGQNGTGVLKPVLRYVPKTEGSWAVDAQTGEVLDISGGGAGLYRNAPLAAETEEAAMDSGSGTMKSLNAVEQAGVDKLEGVLDKDALDRILRAESAYQLSDAYMVQSANYRLVKEDDGRGGERETVLCTLRYSAGQGGEEPPIVYRDEAAGITAPPAPDLYDRTFTVDARTGAVRMLYSSETWKKERTAAVSVSQAREAAQIFLFRFAASAPVDAARLELRDTADNTAAGAASYGFTFARMEHGVFFPADSVTIRVDCVTGAVSGLSFAWHEGLSQSDFPAATNIVSPDTALTAWAETYDAVLAYRLLPRDLDPADPVEAKLISLGMTRFYSLFLSYGLERPAGTEFSQYDNSPGIDAKTGRPVVRTAWTAEKLAYSDTAGNGAEEDIQKLAEYGIGYAGGLFRPEKALTQWELVCLLASSQGYRLNPDQASDEERDSAYSAAVYMGALTREERDDAASLTRGAAVRLLLNAAGYRGMAALSGIWRTDYTDAGSIPDGEQGYAALAQALGLLRGSYGAGLPVTRADAARLLCRLMERRV